MAVRGAAPAAGSWQSKDFCAPAHSLRIRHAAAKAPRKQNARLTSGNDISASDEVTI